MSLREMDLCDEFIDKIKENLDWYEEQYFKNKKYTLFDTAGNRIECKIVDNRIAHLLGVNTDYLVTKGIYKPASSYLILKQLVKDKYIIGGKIKDGYLNMKNLFNPYTSQKISYFKTNISFGINAMFFICQYDKNKAIYKGITFPRDCDFIIVSRNDKGEYFTLDLAKDPDSNICYPVSSRVYDDENEFFNSFKDVLKGQQISGLSGLQIFDNWNYKKYSLYVNQLDKLTIFKELLQISSQYNAIIDVLKDYQYQLQSNHQYNKFEEIICKAITEGTPIDPAVHSLNFKESMIVGVTNVCIRDNLREDAGEYTRASRENEQLKSQNQQLLADNAELSNKIDVLKRKNSDLMDRLAATEGVIEKIKTLVINK